MATFRNISLEKEPKPRYPRKFLPQFPFHFLFSISDRIPVSIVIPIALSIAQFLSQISFYTSSYKNTSSFFILNTKFNLHKRNLFSWNTNSSHFHSRLLGAEPSTFPVPNQIGSSSFHISSVYLARIPHCQMY